MKSSTLCRILRLALVLTIAGDSAQAQDWQSWDEVDIYRSLSDRWHITVPLVLRESFNLENPQLYGGGAIVDCSLDPHVLCSAGYLYVGLPTTGPGYYSNVPLTAVTFLDRFGSVELSDRNRAEKLLGLPGSPVRYRNKLLAVVPLKGSCWSPFMSTEIFFDFTQRTWTQNRFEIGVGARLSERVKVDTYYLERTDFQNRLGDVHAIGLTVEIDLDDHVKQREHP